MWDPSWSTSKILLLIFIVTAMMEITVTVTFRDIAAVLRDKGLILRAFVVNFLLVPALGIVLTTVFLMAEDVRSGIILLAVAPGGLMAINFTRTLCKKIELAAALLFLLTLVGALLTPILANFILESQRPVTVPYQKMMEVGALYILLPLVAGLALNKSLPKFAAALQKPLNIVSAAAFITFSIATMSAKSAAAKAIEGSGALLALTLLMIGAMAFGWIFGGPNIEIRRVLSVNTGMRNLALSLAIATHTFPETSVDLAVIAYTAIGIPIALLFTFYQRRKIKRATAQLAAAA